MSDIQTAFENASYPLAHFDTWLKIAISLGHFWPSFSDDIMIIIRAVYAKGGWSAVHDAVKALAVLSPWHMSFMSIGGIMPPMGLDYTHKTATGRLEISVTADGVAHVSVFRLLGDERILVASYTKSPEQPLSLTYALADADWRALGGTGSPVCQRHTDAVAEALHEGHR